MPADILRDREQAPAFSDLATAAPATPPLDIAGKLRATEEQMAKKREEQQAARDAELAAMKQQAEATKPALRDVEESMARREALAAQRPIQPQTAPPPPPQLRDFLATREGEAPEATITKLIQGIEILASGFTGLARKNGTTAMASLQGALKGWNEGDRERADREFQTWRAATDRMIADHRTRIAEYNALMDDASLSVDQRTQLLKLKAAEAGHDTAMATFRRQNADEDLKFLSDYNKQLLTVQDHALKTQQMHDDKIQHEQTLLEIARLKKSEHDAKQQGVLDNYDDRAIEALAWTALKNEGRVPSVGMGTAGQVVRGRVLKKMAELAATNGIDLSQLPGIAAEMKGAQMEINTASRQLAYWNANIDTFHKHVAQFLELSKKVDRSGRPVVDRAALKFRGKYAGDPEVAAYEAMANEVAMEYAKLAVGTAQGDQSSRAEARDKINASMSPQQIERVMQELVRAGENRKSSWDDAVKRAAGQVSTFGGRISAPMPPVGTSPADGPQPGDLVFDKNGKATTFGRK